MRSASWRGPRRWKPPVPPSRHSTFGGSGVFSRARTTSTPTPSSAIKTFPTPSTSTRSPSAFWLLSLKLPTSHHGRSRAAPLDIVVIEDQVNVHQRKQNEEPHEDVVPLAYGKIATHEGDDPGE